jgi:hypothetical protein
MQDHVSRLVGLEGFEVTGVIEEGDRLDLEVELVARSGCCARCGRPSLEVKERPVVRVRDLPIAGRPGAGGLRGRRGAPVHQRVYGGPQRSGRAGGVGCPIPGEISESPTAAALMPATTSSTGPSFST